MKASAILLTALTVLVMTGTGAMALIPDEHMLAGRPAEANRQVLHLVRAVSDGGDVVARVDLPVVTITARKIVPDLYLAIRKDGVLLASVELPEVLVTAPYNRATLYPAVYATGAWIPSVDLPAVDVYPSARIAGGLVADTWPASTRWQRLAGRLPYFGVILLAAWWPF